DLDAIVLPIADVDVAVVARDEAVRQVKLVRLGLAGLAPRRDEPAGGGEAMDAGVAIAVGHVEVTRRGRDHLGRIVEGAGRAGYELAGALAPGVRMLPARAQDLERLAVERVREAHRIVAVGEIDHVLGDMDAVWVGEGADAPAA